MRPGSLPDLRIESISPDEVNLGPLRDEAAREGFRFLDRLAAEWADGTNRFESDGEKLLGAYCDDRLIAVGGLNREPYEPAPRTGRLRHLYVLPAYRRRGVANTIIGHLLESAEHHFDAVRLRTDTPEAASLYQKIGFKRVPLDTATHMMTLSGAP